MRSGLLLWKKMKIQSNTAFIKYWIHTICVLGLSILVSVIQFLKFEEIEAQRQGVKGSGTGTIWIII